MERFFDIILSGLALLVLSPIFIIVIFILKLTGEGEIFFLQERIGKDGKLFKLYKFATMLKDSPNIGTGTITTKEDPRVLPVGKFLRKTKINELPQLLNIFFGHMSVIGPRPLTCETFESYSIDIKEIIKSVKPGLSGIGSIIFRDEEEIMDGEMATINFYNNTIAPYKGSLEIWFVSNKSLYIYFVAIFVTIWAVINPKSKIAWKLFSNLPKPPKELRTPLNYT
tara:strand:- start:4251 stop:4925 length:675 start_codon:yes stop_codon:yes gene_type:complete